MKYLVLILTIAGFGIMAAAQSAESDSMNDFRQIANKLNKRHISSEESDCRKQAAENNTDPNNCLHLPPSSQSTVEAYVPPMVLRSTYFTGSPSLSDSQKLKAVPPPGPASGQPSSTSGSGVHAAE